jgi:hypothetical protein
MAMKADRRSRAPIMLLVGAAAFGALLARVIDWRGHAHPR